MGKLKTHGLSLGVCLLSAVLAILPAFAGTYNVKDYGAKADGKTDDTAAFQKALDEAKTVTGSTVFAASGRYLIAGTITVTATTTLQGEYQNLGGSHGTILLATGGKGKSDGPGCIVMEVCSKVKGIAMEYPEQSAEAKEPIPYPYAITADAACRIEDVFLLNPYLGINLDCSHGNLVRNVTGEPLKVGINADHIFDVSRIENVHFWPFFTLGKPLRDWVQKKGVAYQFGRSDWQSCLNIFSFGYHTGFRFYASKELKAKGLPAGQTNGSFVGIGVDSCIIAIDVEDCFSIGVSITNGMFGPFAGADTRAVLLRKSNTGNLNMVNCNFWAVTDTLAEVHSGSLNMTGCNIHEWGIVKKEAPCFILGGGRLNVNGCTINKGGLFATLDGEKTRAMFSAIMGTDPLTVVNHIGDRAVFGTNSPKLKIQK